MSTGTEVAIRLYDVAAREDSRPACQDERAFAKADSLREETGQSQPDCATLEKDFFRLDGSFEPFPQEPQQRYWGLWSNEMSDGDGAFARPPVLQIGFAAAHSSVGLTMLFYRREQDYVKHLRVRWLDREGNAMSVKEFFPQSAEPFLKNKVEGYYGLEITFLKTLRPYRYLKLSGIDYGLELLLDGGTLSSASVLEEVDLTGSSVSVNTLELTIYSSVSDFSPLNPSGYFSMFQQNQKLTAAALMEGEREEMGSFFLQSWEADSKDNVKLHATDAVGIMDRISFPGDIYLNTPVESVLAELSAGTGATLELDDALVGKKLNGHLPGCTARQALGQIALAIGGVVDSSRGEAVKLYPLPQRPSALIPTAVKFSGQRIVRRPDITGIDLTAHSYTPISERYTAFDEELAAGSYTVLFGEPTHTPGVTGAVAGGGGANHIDFTVNSPGRVTVTGGRYLHGKQIVSERLVQRAVNPGEKRLRVDDATLVCGGNAPKILQRLRDCCKHDISAEFSMKLGGQRVADMVLVQSSGGESIKGIIECMETDLTGGGITKLRISARRVETINSSYAGEQYAGQSLGVM